MTGTNNVEISKGSRVPAHLQAVFIAASLGREIEEAPPKAAGISYYISWIFGIAPSVDDNQESKAEEHTSKHKAKRSKPNQGQRHFFGSWGFASSKDAKKSRRPSTATKPCTYSIPITEFKPKQVSPQAYISSILRNRGYSTKEYPALQSAYFNSVTPLQEASYGLYVIEVVRDGNITALRELMNAGLSPNACNRHSESLVHMASRWGKPDLLRVLMEFSCEVQVADSRGRTPLHDACWARNPDLQIVEMLLRVDKRLLYIADERGALPLSYLKEESWTVFTKFFMAKKDEMWPDMDIALIGFEKRPPLTRLPPNSCPVPDPHRKINLKLASLVAEGRIHPDEAEFLSGDTDEDMTLDDSDFFDCEEYDDEDEDVTSGGAGVSVKYEDPSETYNLDEEEMERILYSICNTSSIPLAWSK